MKNEIADWLAKKPRKVEFHPRNFRHFEAGLNLLSELGNRSMGNKSFSDYNIIALEEKVIAVGNISKKEFARMKSGKWIPVVKEIQSDFHKDMGAFDLENKVQPLVNSQKLIGIRKSFREQFYPKLNKLMKEEHVPDAVHTLIGLQISAFGKRKDARREIEMEGVNFERCQKIVEQYINEQMIIAELKSFEANGTFLLKHEFFEEQNIRAELVLKSASYLASGIANAKERIRRKEIEIKKGNKPHLKSERLAGVEYNTRLIEIIEEILKTR